MSAIAYEHIKRLDLHGDCLIVEENQSEIEFDIQSKLLPTYAYIILAVNDDVCSGRYVRRGINVRK